MNLFGFLPKREYHGTYVDYDTVTPRIEQSRSMGIRASSFRPTNPLDGLVEPGTFVVAADEGLSYDVHVLPKGMGLPIGPSPDLYTEPPKVYFDGDVEIPTLGFFDPPHDPRQRSQPWMSLTPAEMWSQASGIRAATGQVVVGGLGMGWLLTEIAKKPTVKSIVVIEESELLLDWFGRRLCERVPKVCDVVQGDFFVEADRFDIAKTRFIVDIWPKMGDAEWDRRLARLRARGAKAWAWGSARPSNYHKLMMKQESKEMGL